VSTPTRAWTAIQGRFYGAKYGDVASSTECSSGTGERASNRFHDGCFGGKEQPSLLRDELTVHPDGELVVAALLEEGVDTQLPLQRLRHTGGLWWE